MVKRRRSAVAAADLPSIRDDLQRWSREVMDSTGAARADEVSDALRSLGVSRRVQEVAVRDLERHRDVVERAAPHIGDAVLWCGVGGDGRLLRPGSRVDPP